MESLPLQKYKKAYDLHYKSNDPQQAGELYRELIQTYPDSDVSMYASIQLAKIQSLRGPGKTFEDVPAKKSRSGVFVMVLLILNLLLTTGVITGFVLHSQIVANRQEGLAKISQAVTKLSAGKEDDALGILNEVKIIYKGDITPYAIAADIYCKNNNFLKARSEYEAFQRLHPEDMLITSAVKKVNELEDAYIREERKRQMIKDTVKVEKVKKTVTKKPRYREPEPIPRKIHRNDISYF